MENLSKTPQVDAASDILTEHAATDEQPFHFTDSGLDNVFLVGIKYFTSVSGRIVAEIPAIKQLMSLIAHDVVYCEVLLKGDQVRFLRKRLGMKAIDYAKLLRIDAATLSRIENDKQPPSEQLDVLVRMSYLLLCGDPKLSKEVELLKQEMTSRLRREQFKIVMKVTAANEWQDQKQAA